MDIERELSLPILLEKKSHFLLGPRSTGKTTLIRQQLPNALTINLLKSDYEFRLSNHPEELEALIDDRGGNPGIIVIDEVQKAPQLLNEVHRLIEERKLKFLLTGSSARKLKGETANLLAGRAWMAHLFPLTWHELKTRFKLERYLRYGGLPQVYLGENPEDELNAYVHTYLYEEIRAEALVRKIPAFSRFLEVAALSSGQLVNFTEIGNDVALSPSTVREYYQVLEDTLMGFLLPPWTKSRKRKAIQTAKFYFFDMGVAHALSRTRDLDRNSDLYGRSFEHFIGMELRAFNDYRQKKMDLRFWRSINGQEVDFILNDEAAIEVKATRRVSPKDLKGLQALIEEGKIKKYYLVSQDPIPAVRQKIHCLPWNQFLEKLWRGEVI